MRTLVSRDASEMLSNVGAQDDRDSLDRSRDNPYNNTIIRLRFPIEAGVSSWSSKSSILTPVNPELRTIRVICKCESQVTPSRLSSSSRPARQRDAAINYYYIAPPCHYTWMRCPRCPSSRFRSRGRRGEKKEGQM